MRRQFLLALLAGGTSLSIGVLALLALDANRRSYASYAELTAAGPEAQAEFVPIIPQSARKLRLAFSGDSGAMQCRFDFDVSDDAWIQKLRPSRVELSSAPSMLRDGDWGLERHSVVTYCFGWPVADAKAWGGKNISFAVNRSTGVAFCWWSGPAARDCAGE